MPDLGGAGLSTRFKPNLSLRRADLSGFGCSAGNSGGKIIHQCAVFRAKQPGAWRGFHRVTMRFKSTNEVFGRSRASGSAEAFVGGLMRIEGGKDRPVQFVRR